MACSKQPDSEISVGSELEEYFNNRERRIILIGKTGAGKSTTGNNILDEKAFKACCSASSVTSKCQLGQAKRFGRDVLVVDTPGIFDTGLSDDDVYKEIVKCITISSPGPHAIILVIQSGRFTDEEAKTVTKYRELFGDDMIKYMILLFTWTDELESGEMKLEDLWSNGPASLEELVKNCNNRTIAFKKQSLGHVQQLFDMINKMVAMNGDRYYTSEPWSKCTTIILQREREIEQEEEQETPPTEREKQVVSLDRKVENINIARYEAVQEEKNMLLRWGYQTAKVAGHVATLVVEKMIIAPIKFFQRLFE